MTSSPSSARPIALVAPLYPPDPGGLAAAAARLARGLSAHCPVEVLVPTSAIAPGAVTVASEDGPTVVRFGAGPREETMQQWFELLIRRGPYRLVHGVYLSETGFLAAYAARYLNIACLVAARGNDLDRDVFRPDRLTGIRYAVEQADAVVGVASTLCRSARALGARRVELIPNGVDGMAFRPVPRDPALQAALGLEGAFPVIGFFGEARQKKGLPTLLKAFLLLQARHPRARLLLVGGVRDRDRGLLEVFLAQHAGLAEAVSVVPAVPQDALPAYYALTDMLWHPSYQDGMPNAILEGLACERLTVGAAAGGIPDVLTPARYGDLLVPTHDEGALAAATERLLADPERTAARGREAREDVLARFSPSSEVEAYLRLYGAIAPSSA